MVILKFILLSIIMGLCTSLGLIKANKYKLRENELYEMQKSLNILITKMRYTYESLPTLFYEIGSDIKGNVGNIFLEASKYMKNLNAGEAWKNAMEKENNNFTKDDKNVIKGMAKLLGQTDLEGQITQLHLTIKLLENQIIQATKQKEKNTKLYRTLGATIGLAIMVIFI